MRPPSRVEVDAAITDWLTSLSAISRSLFSIESLAAAHASFERIQPFIDGSGRTGRLLTNLILIAMGYPPAIIFKSDRTRYLRALQSADEGDPGPLGELFVRAVTANLYRFVVPAIAGLDTLVPLSALAAKVRSVVALRAAIERSRLGAQKGTDGQWRSTRNWVDDYVRSKHRKT